MSMIKLKVKVGSLKFEQPNPNNPDGVYSKGDVFEVSEERAQLFEASDVSIVTDEPAEVKAPVISEGTAGPVVAAPKKLTLKKTVKAEPLTAPEPEKDASVEVAETSETAT